MTDPIGFWLTTRALAAVEETHGVWLQTAKKLGAFCAAAFVNKKELMHGQPQQFGDQQSSLKARDEPVAAVALICGFPIPGGLIHK